MRNHDHCARPALELLEARTLLSFFPPVNYSTPPFSTSVAAADFNGDLAPDFVVASGDTVVSLRLNKGDGTFNNAISLNAGSGAYWVTTGDFNGDERVDIAVANSFSARVNVLLGNGNGTFQAAKSFVTGPNAVHLAAGDVNGDGKQDLAVASANSGSVNVLLGNGDGTFQPFKRFRAGIKPFGVAIGDFDEDGKPDLVVANLRTLNSTVSVLKGNGDGTFGRAIPYLAYGRETRDVIAVDMNIDGNLDIVAANSASNTVLVMLGNGDGTFRDGRTYPGGNATMHLVVADFDENYTMDVAMVNYVYPVGHVSVLSNAGDGTLSPFVKYEVGNSPFALAAADFNGDSMPDLAAVNSYSHNASILINSPGRSAPNPEFIEPAVIQMTEADDVMFIDPSRFGGRPSSDSVESRETWVVSSMSRTLQSLVKSSSYMDDEPLPDILSDLFDPYGKDGPRNE
jgi:hypothetical protein